MERIPGQPSSLLWLVSCFFCMGAGCTSESPIGPIEPGATIRPKVGTTYTTTKADTDSSGREVSGTARMIVTTVLGTGLTYRGRSDLTLMLQDSGRFYFHYDTSGDFSTVPDLPDSIMGVDWQTFPVGTHQTIPGASFDTTLPGGISISESIIVSYVGTETISTPAGRFGTHRVSQTHTTIFSIGAIKSSSKSIVDFWYAPSIGYIAKAESSVQSTSGGKEGGSREVLTAVDLK